MHAQALGRCACPHPTEAEQPVCLTMEGMWPAGGWLDVQSLRPPWGLILERLPEGICADPVWHSVPVVCSLGFPLSLKLFRTMWFHLLPQRGVVFHYLQIVVFMDWDKHLVGRSFFSHGHSNLNSIISPAYLEREKIHLLNTVFLFFWFPREMRHHVTASLELDTSVWNTSRQQLWW